MAGRKPSAPATILVPPRKPATFAMAIERARGNARDVADAAAQRIHDEHPGLPAGWQFLKLRPAAIRMAAIGVLLGSLCGGVANAAPAMLAGVHATVQGHCTQ